MEPPQYTPKEAHANVMENANAIVTDIKTLATEISPKPQIPNFTGPPIEIIFPKTENKLTFTPVETSRGDSDSRWSYPSPIPSVETLFPASPSLKIEHYTNTLSPELVLELIEDQLSRISQTNWRLACEDVAEDNTLDLISEFTLRMIKGKTRPGITPEGMMKKAAQLRKEAMELKKANNNKMNDKIKDILSEALKWKNKADEAFMAEINKEGL